MTLRKYSVGKALIFQFTISDRNGRNLTNDVITDPRVGGISQVQEVYGRGQTWRLTQLWYRQKFFDGGLDIKLGRMNFWRGLRQLSLQIPELGVLRRAAG